MLSEVEASQPIIINMTINNAEHDKKTSPATRYMQKKQKTQFLHKKTSF